MLCWEIELITSHGVESTNRNGPIVSLDYPGIKECGGWRTRRQRKPISLGPPSVEGVGFESTEAPTVAVHAEGHRCSIVARAGIIGGRRSVATYRKHCSRVAMRVDVNINRCHCCQSQMGQLYNIPIVERKFYLECHSGRNLELGFVDLPGIRKPVVLAGYNLAQGLELPSDVVPWTAGVVSDS